MSKLREMLTEAPLPVFNPPKFGLNVITGPTEWSRSANIFQTPTSREQVEEAMSSVTRSG